MRLCVIPARGGSKRIPRKNIKSFCGQPMIGLSIAAAIESECFDKVIVSTDDEEIANLSQSLGAEVPFIRPPYLSDDHTPTTPVVKHAIEWLEGNSENPTEVCCLYATAPFVRAVCLKNAYKRLIETTSDYCFSVTSFSFPIQRAIKIINSDRIQMFWPEYFSARSQDLENSYHDAGQFYWGLSRAWKEEKTIFSDISCPYIIPRYLVQDIDTPEDWIRAEVMYKTLKRTGIL